MEVDDAEHTKQTYNSLQEKLKQLETKITIRKLIFTR